MLPPSRRLFNRDIWTLSRRLVDQEQQTSSKRGRVGLEVLELVHTAVGLQAVTAVVAVQEGQHHFHWGIQNLPRDALGATPERRDLLVVKLNLSKPVRDAAQDYLTDDSR